MSELEHIEDVLTEEDFLPAGLDDRVRELARDFDDSYDAAKKTALAKKAAGGGGGGAPRLDDDGEPKESRRAKAKRLEKERKAKEASKTAERRPSDSWPPDDPGIRCRSARWSGS